MTDKQAIQEVQNNQRAKTKFSGSKFTYKENSNHSHNYRIIACDSETDVLECSLCGKQRLASCNFDEEYA